MTERIIRAGDVELWSQSLGDAGAPPLLLISGDCQSAMSWPDELVDLLTSAGRRVLRYDHRDTGRSTGRDFASHPYDFDDLAADAVAVLDGWDLRAAHVVGFGMGAALAQLIALDHPERLTAMTLLGAHSLAVDFFGNWERALTGEPTLDGLPTPRRWFVELIFESPPPSDPEAELEWAVDHWQALAGDQLPFDRAEFRRWELRARNHATLPRKDEHPHGLIRQGLTGRGPGLKGITTPTLVVQGPLDPISPPPHGRHLAESIPAAKFAEIPGMGHALPRAVHEPLARAILSAGG